MCIENAIPPICDACYREWLFAEIRHWGQRNFMTVLTTSTASRSVVSCFFLRLWKSWSDNFRFVTVSLLLHSTYYLRARKLGQKVNWYEHRQTLPWIRLIGEIFLEEIMLTRKTIVANTKDSELLNITFTRKHSIFLESSCMSRSCFNMITIA